MWEKLILFNVILFDFDPISEQYFQEQSSTVIIIFEKIQ